MHLLKKKKNNNNNIGDLKASVVSIRHSRSFSNVVKVANFSFNEGSGWVCASVC